MSRPSTSQEMYGLHEVEEEISRRLARWHEGIPSAPVRAIVQLTTKCNLDCLFCESAASLRLPDNVAPELNREQWCRVVEDGTRAGIIEWWFPGIGEPLFDARLFVEVAEALKKENPRATFKTTTNGTMFREKIVKRLVSLGMGRVNVSIDGPTESIHDTLRGRDGAFAKAIDAIKLFQKHKHLLATNSPEIAFTFVLNARNYAHLPAYVGMAAELGVTMITINPLRISKYNQERVDGHSLRIPEDESQRCRSFLKEASRIAQREGIDFHVNGDDDLELGSAVLESAPGFDVDRTPSNADGTPRVNQEESFLGTSCYEPWYSLSIDPWGNAGYCANWGFGQEQDNVLVHGILPVWYGPLFTRMREQILRRMPYRQCFGCGISRNRDLAKQRLNEYLKKRGEEK